MSISGQVKGTDGEPVEGVTIGIKENARITTISDTKGYYTLTVESGKTLTIVFQDVNHDPVFHTFETKTGNNLQYSPTLVFKHELSGVEITDTYIRAEEAIKLNAKLFTQLPMGSQNLESLIKTQIGVSSNNELSSGYSVRGGNYDENLVYVNDIEVYRPFLVRSGQQEGLSFANPNMVQNLSFSAGGFEARYGDKLSSVLDITYRKPLKFGGSASASLLGGNLQLEGISKNRLVAWNIGARYRTNIYLLNSLDTKGEYRPTASDVQSFLTFDV
ncbi:MAG: carboxypeptidase regulatory-like domain-containing protein, partial [Bacteroidia bacterium]|nr:carboxypeptidase regulatory-like domain-containing protein [Bacteroidia bacterium]